MPPPFCREAVRELFRKVLRPLTCDLVGLVVVVLDDLRQTELAYVRFENACVLT